MLKLSVANLSMPNIVFEHLKEDINPLTSVPDVNGKAFLVPFCPSCLWECSTNQNPPTAHIFEGLRGS